MNKKTENKKTESKKSEDTRRKPENNKRRPQGSRKPYDKRNRGAKTPESDVAKPEVNGQDAEKKSSYSSWNDVSWYTRFPELSDAVAKLAFVQYPGTDMPIGTILPSGDGATEKSIDVNIPGLLTIDYWPTIGQSEGVNDPASVAGTQLFKQVRKAFSGTLKADGPDFIMWVLGMDGVYSYISWLRRLYGIISMVRADNKFFGVNMLVGLGFTQAEAIGLANHKIDLFGYLNQLIYMANTFKIPDSFDYITRHFWMNDKFYLDADWYRGQLYAFQAKGFFHFSATASDKGGSVSVAEWREEGKTDYGDAIAQRLFEFGRTLVSDMLDDDTNLEIQGYINRAFEGTKWFILPQVAFEYTPDFKHDIEVLAAIHNLRVVPGSVDVASLSVTQNPDVNSVVSHPVTDMSAAETRIKNLSLFVDIPVFDPGTGDVLIATRLMSWVDNIGVASPVYSGSEIIDSVTFTWIKPILGVNPVDLVRVIDVTDLGSINSALEAIAHLSRWDWHPFVFLGHDTNPKGTNATIEVFGDIYNPGPISIDQLKRMHEVCLYSEFNSFGF